MPKMAAVKKKSVAKRKVRRKSQAQLIAELQAKVKELEKKTTAQDKEIAKLTKNVQEIEVDEGPLEVLYGLPDAPRRQMFVFPDCRIQIFPSQEEAIQALNSGKERPAAVWELKKRTIMPKT